MNDEECDKIFRELCSYYGITVKELNFINEGKIPVLIHSGSQQPVLGLRNIISLVRNGELSKEESAMEDEWLQFASTKGQDSSSSVNPAVLKELNDYLSDKVYIAGNTIGPCDLLIYYFTYSGMAKLTLQDKENILHISRWFDNVQQNNRARGSRPLIAFSRTKLYD